MNIKEAKQQIKNTLRAYLQRDGLGNYKIPSVRQRPVLLIGPPGIGKTQIMEQIASEENVGLVAYTITHHTRQSAIGLPFIEKRIYNGKEYSVTEYTMSEIIGSVYSLMENTGIKEGILFLDEINCVSETLAPMMLQFLQCKTFGNQKLPEGWLIVAAGNPPEYNRSVRDFDVVTLDRVKRMNIEEDFSVWKEYAVAKGLHGSVVSYLDIKKDNFYKIENSPDGLQFATARGWEDLSEIISSYEELNIPVDVSVIGQYIQLPSIARDFANYLNLYRKYEKAYHVDAILCGNWSKVSESEFRNAPFDEKLAVLNLLWSRLAQSAASLRMQDEITSALYNDLRVVKDNSGKAEDILESMISEKRKAIEISAAAGQNDRRKSAVLKKETDALGEYLKAARQNSDSVMEELKKLFAKETGSRESLAEETGRQMENAFRFIESAEGQSQSMVFFVTDITACPDTSWFVGEFGSDAYFRNNHDLLLDETRKELIHKIMS